MNSLIPANFGAVSPRFGNTPVTDDLSSGIQSSFGLIGYKGKVWSIRYRGEETQLMRDDGDGPRGSIEVVIINASPVVSKVWYEQGYVEGSNAAPDCFSNNGVTPEPTSAKKQCDSCAMCPHNQWGSRITPAGKQGKACADSKRLAVVPLNDLENAMFGGAMLLRVPAASLQDLAMYGQKMNQLGYPYYSVGTRIQFDAQESYPKFIFSAIRPLTDDEADTVISERDGHTVKRILSENEFATAPVATEQDVAAAFEQPPQTQGNAATTGVGAQARAAAAKTAPANKAATSTQGATQQAKPAAKRTPPPVKEVTQEVTETPAEEVETEEEREMRELQERMAALKAKKEAAAKAETAKPAQTAKATTAAKQAAPEVEDAVSEEITEGDPMNAASDFESELDDMLNGLLP